MKKVIFSPVSGLIAGILIAWFFIPRLGPVPKPKDEAVVEAPVASPRLSPTAGAKPSTSGEVAEERENTNLVTIKPVAAFRLDQVQRSKKPQQQ